MRKTLAIASCVLTASLLAGCARPLTDAQADPYEKFNRTVYAFNTDVDHLLIRPVAKVYDTVVPPPLQRGVTNFFDNVRELTTVPNDILQGKLTYAMNDFFRFAINSTFGIGGLFDVASRIGLPKHYEDFGLTFAYWSGGKMEPYLMLPILGPSTTRAAYGRIYNISTSPWFYIKPATIGWAAYGLEATNFRASILDADKLVAESFDPYVFVRNAYLQKRRQRIAENETNLRPTLPYNYKAVQAAGSHDNDQPTPPPEIGDTAVDLNPTAATDAKTVAEKDAKDKAAVVKKLKENGTHTGTAIDGASVKTDVVK